MKNLKKFVAVAAVVGILGTTGAVMAATTKTPAEIASELTGKSVESLFEERADGKTFGTIADEAGKLDEFMSQMLEQKKALLDQRVQEGKLTQEQADKIYNTMLENQANCDGTGRMGLGMKSGAGFGQGMGNGQGRGMGNGQGSCAGTGYQNGGRGGMRAGRGLNK